MKTANTIIPWKFFFIIGQLILSMITLHVKVRVYDLLHFLSFLQQMKN